MVMLKILDYPDPRLRRKAPAVEDVNDPAIQQQIDDIIETIKNTEHCGGLAATQLNLKDPMRITIINHRPEHEEPLVLINPEIIATEGESYDEEGCMSVYPNEISAKVKRAEIVTARALDRQGSPIELKDCDNYLAKCLQHEIDHLNGILYIDHLSSLKRRLIEKKIAKLRRHLHD